MSSSQQAIEGGPSEALPLAVEMAKAHRQMVEYYRQQCKASPGEAVEKVGEWTDADQEQRILNSEPDQVSWLDLHMLAERDPDLQVQRWEEIKDYAREELRSGHRAGFAMDSMTSRPWNRAQFLAVRDELAEQWLPRNGIELTLIDVMAQAYTAYLFWQERLTLWSALEPETDNQSVREKGTWNPPRVRDFQAVDQAATMVDRFNRLFIRSLRSLRDLRRYSPMVIVQNASQVNVGDQQVNVSSGASNGNFPEIEDAEIENQHDSRSEEVY